MSLQAGSRRENYQLAFTEPFLFDRNITGGVDVYKRSLRYIDQFTQEVDRRQPHHAASRSPASRACS